jgi:hypothetical protein
MNLNVMIKRVPVKAAEDSRTLPRPRDWRVRSHATLSARFWSAAVVCRFSYDRHDAQKPN